MFIYYAGHGQYDKAREHGWWVPTDGEARQPGTLIENTTILRYIKGMQARHVYLVADSCFSGSLFGTRALPPITDRWYAELYKERSRWGLTSGGTEPVEDTGLGGHSTFAYFLVKMLRENKYPYLVPSTIYDSLALLVSNNTTQVPRSEPLRQSGDEGGQFVFRLTGAALPIEEAETEGWVDILLPMVHVQGGTFRRGCTEEQSSCLDIMKPTHFVSVDSFEIGKYEVTQDLWEAMMGENPSRSESCPRCPVEYVNWDDVKTFLKKLNSVTDERYGFRLPTEAEWEYAARGGQQSQGYQYAGSDALGLVAWYDENSGEGTHPAGLKEPNELGLYDMSGNVWEWVEDCWNDSYWGAPLDGSAWTSGDCSERIVRGGSWSTKPWGHRSTRRASLDIGLRSSNLGFRLARTLD